MTAKVKMMPQPIPPSKANGKAIQPLYNGHTTDHVDYSHGIRLI